MKGCGRDLDNIAYRNARPWDRTGCAHCSASPAPWLMATVPTCDQTAPQPGSVQPCSCTASLSKVGHVSGSPRTNAPTPHFSLYRLLGNFSRSNPC